MPNKCHTPQLFLKLSWTGTWGKYKNKPTNHVSFTLKIKNSRVIETQQLRNWCLDDHMTTVTHGNSCGTETQSPYRHTTRPNRQQTREHEWDPQVRQSLCSERCGDTSRTTFMLPVSFIFFNLPWGIAHLGQLVSFILIISYKSWVSSSRVFTAGNGEQNERRKEGGFLTHFGLSWEAILKSTGFSLELWTAF